MVRVMDGVPLKQIYITNGTEILESYWNCIHTDNYKVFHQIAELCFVDGLGAKGDESVAAGHPIFILTAKIFQDVSPCPAVMANSENR